MSHEPECNSFQPFSPSLNRVCICAAVSAAYKRGYTQGHNEAMALHLSLDALDWVYGYNRHGKGENP